MCTNEFVYFLLTVLNVYPERTSFRLVVSIPHPVFGEKEAYASVSLYLSMLQYRQL